MLRIIQIKIAIRKFWSAPSPHGTPCKTLRGAAAGHAGGATALTAAARRRLLVVRRPDGVGGEVVGHPLPVCARGGARLSQQLPQSLLPRRRAGGRAETAAGAVAARRISWCGGARRWARPRRVLLPGGTAALRRLPGRGCRGAASGPWGEPLNCSCLSKDTLVRVALQSHVVGMLRGRVTGSYYESR